MMNAETQRWFEALLAAALRGVKPERLPDETEWPALVDALQQHKVASIVYDALARVEAPESWLAALEGSALEAARQSYHLLFTTRYLVACLEEAGITAAVLKGPSAARYYPVPEMRKSGDVDLLLTDPGQLETASRVFTGLGMKLKPEQHATHHQEWVTQEEIDVELHTRLIDLTDREEADRCIRRHCAAIPQPLPRVEVMGVLLPVLPPAWEAYHLLLHMAQHFLGAGFGVRLLCDWVLFWNRPVAREEIATFLTMVHEAGLDGFLGMVTSVCVRRLGLEGCEGGLKRQGEQMVCQDGSVFCALVQPEKSERFLADVYAGGDFGGQDQGRMVMVEGHGLKAYVRTFHRQMCRNYPKASRCNLLWPVLWILTFVTFMRNNRRLNRGSIWQILRKTRERSGLLGDEMELFR